MNDFLNQLWQQFETINPKATQIKSGLVQLGEKVVNDHIAIRTLNVNPISIEKLEPLILAMGYQVLEPYRFDDKKLNAKAYIHPNNQPKIFLSELCVNELPQNIQSILLEHLSKADWPKFDESLFYSGCPWPNISWQQYQTLYDTSQYAAWFLTMGFRANHFTISINHLEKLQTIEQINDWIKSLSIDLNQTGGEIKGSAQVLLEQSSTMAHLIDYSFSDAGIKSIPGVFYEFAKRYPDSNKQLFPGFVTGNADKIFESTKNKS